LHDEFVDAPAKRKEDEMKVQEFMTQGVRTVGLAATLQDAAREMWEGDCGALPVLDPANRVVAMLTDRDACMAAFTQGKRLSEIPVRTAMSRRLLACRPDDAIGAAEALMREHQVRRLPVVDERGTLVGILSLNDIAVEATRQQARPHPSVTSAEVGSTLAEICRHRARPLAPLVL
jgi:CBS-domain-containing membrane protein